MHSYLRLVNRQKQKGEVAYAEWWSAEKRSTTNRDVLTVVIWMVMVAFGLTAPLYALDHKAGGRSCGTKKRAKVPEGRSSRRALAMETIPKTIPEEIGLSLCLAPSPRSAASTYQAEEDGWSG
ncbi:hypothetical protein [Luteibacter sp. UNC138MFCol5.1]|uniref:hypothetical protein n=1 Tax=Luteibacter sp. UNC138MFCol5.1 TaxID=1502774 RepID=UPI0011608F51|nr:hypothetical protein [Luteibacter sp. UNC138MFCol5.1]